MSNLAQKAHRMADNTALATVGDHQAFLTRQEEKLARWMTGGLKSESMIRFALHQIQTDDLLRACTPTSVYMALLSCAVSGLEPGPLKGEAFLIPRKSTKKYVENGIGKEITITEATFMAGWKGIQKQCRRAGINVVANVVHERDVFEIDQGTNQHVLHKPALTNRGAVIGAVAWAKLPNNGLEIEWLDLERIEKIRMAGGGKSDAWTKWYDQMARKSALRSIGKRLPMGDDYYRARELDLAYEQGNPVSPVLDEYTDGAASEVVGRDVVEVAAFRKAPDPEMVFDSANGKDALGRRTPEVNTKKSDDAKPGSKAKPIEAKATEVRTDGGPRPGDHVGAARPANPPASSAGTSGATSGASTSAPPSGDASPPSTSKLDAAKAKVEAKKADPTTPALPATRGPSSTPSPATDSSPSTESGSDGQPTANPGSASDPGFGDDGAFDEGFGDEQPPVKSVAAFIAWVNAQTDRVALREGKREWLKWSKEANLPVEDTQRMQLAYNARAEKLG